MRLITRIGKDTAYAGTWMYMRVGTTKYRYCSIFTETKGVTRYTRVELYDDGKVERAATYGNPATALVAEILYQEVQAKMEKQKDETTS
jgi:hypothetical protein